MPAIRRDEGGFMLIELMVTVMVISVAVLALTAVYEAAIFSLHAAGKQSAAAQLANDQLELYGSVAYASIGLDSTALASAKASDAYYASDETALAGATGPDVTIASCGSSARCTPVQSLTGSDRKSYRVETFVRDVTVNGQTERIVTVVVRAASDGSKAVTYSAGFDQGPRS
jgi:Tfp pilus assembly protein PilV